MGYCRKRAVEAGHSWAILLYFIVSVPLVSYLLYRFNSMYNKISGLDQAVVYELIYFIDFFVLLFLSYRVFWYLIKIPFVNTLFTYTTLTRYYRRYHQPETRLKHMVSFKKRDTASFKERGMASSKKDAG
jgi:hypothetical protein